MISPVPSAGALAALVMAAAVVGIESRAAPQPQLPLHLLSVAAALRDAEQLSRGAEELSRGAEVLSRGAEVLSSDAEVLSREAVVLSREADSPLERPPLPAPLESPEAEFAEFSGRTSRPRRSKKSRRRGGLRLDRDQYQFWLRSGECRPTAQGEEQFFCPTPDSQGSWRCITADALCDGARDCAGGEDEHGTACLFYKAISDRLSTLTDHMLK